MPAPLGKHIRMPVASRPCEVLQEFLARAWGPMTNREWAEKLGVSKTTVARWRKEYANEIKKRP